MNSISIDTWRSIFHLIPFQSILNLRIVNKRVLQATREILEFHDYIPYIPRNLGILFPKLRILMAFIYISLEFDVNKLTWQWPSTLESVDFIRKGTTKDEGINNSHRGHASMSYIIQTIGYYCSNLYLLSFKDESLIPIYQMCRECLGTISYRPIYLPIMKKVKDYIIDISEPKQNVVLCSFFIPEYILSDIPATNRLDSCNITILYGGNQFEITESFIGTFSTYKNVTIHIRETIKLLFRGEILDNDIRLLRVIPKLLTFLKPISLNLHIERTDSNGLPIAPM